MSKLMEIIDKSPDFKNGTCSFKFLDTTFNQLTRKIGSKAGANFTTVKAGDVLSKELLQSLNNKEITLRNRLQTWQTKLNDWIKARNSDRNLGAETFNYTFTSINDYSSKYIAGETLADYYLLSEFVSAEKELYEFANYYSKQHMKYLQNRLKEWSKRRKYWSSVKSIKFQITFEHRQDEAYVKDSQGLTTQVVRSGDYNLEVIVSGLDQMKLGEKRTITFFSKRKDGLQYYEATLPYPLTRTALGVATDDGIVDGGLIIADGGNYVTSLSKTWEVHEWAEISSPHFDCTEDNLSLNWFLNRVLIREF